MAKVTQREMTKRIKPFDRFELESSDGIRSGEIETVVWVGLFGATSLSLRVKWDDGSKSLVSLVLLDGELNFKSEEPLG